MEFTPPIHSFVFLAANAILISPPPPPQNCAPLHEVSSLAIHSITKGIGVLILSLAGSLFRGMLYLMSIYFYLPNSPLTLLLIWIFWRISLYLHRHLSDDEHRPLQLTLPLGRQSPLGRHSLHRLWPILLGGPRTQLGVLGRGPPHARHDLVVTRAGLGWRHLSDLSSAMDQAPVQHISGSLPQILVLPPPVAIPTWPRSGR
ncbi:hypothetical protein GUJ93_ZPchr0005g15673 [Zizania palustris]|uniref:Uncharacterized protein n=1 Tax=Zizania palustris TaxID=103762 RepID=A0A8J5VIV7_ZIZPA|nr:hypothetical protein GUJ93_ZPchr0005g15673 [Zizania palustris]